LLIFDLVPPAELAEYARNLVFPEFELARFLPNRAIDDLDYRFYRGALIDEDVATFRAFDTESPISKRGANLVRVSGELPAISRKIMLGEEQRLRLRLLMQNGGVLADGTRVPQDLIDQIFNDSRRMTRAVQARMELARAEALTTGKCVINENGYQARVEYGVPSGNFRTVANKWNVNGGDPIAELIAIVQDYRTLNGYAPAMVLTSTKAVNALLFNAGVRAYFALPGGAIPPIVTRDQISALLISFNLPPIETYDTALRIAGVATRLIPDDLALLLPGAAEPAASQAFETETGNVAQGTMLLGETLWGITAEAIELGGAGQIETTALPGIVVTLLKTFNPIQTWTNASAIGIPIIGNPNGIFVLNVLA